MSKRVSTIIMLLVVLVLLVIAVYELAPERPGHAPPLS